MSITDSWYGRIVEGIAKRRGFSVDVPVRELAPEHIDYLLRSPTLIVLGDQPGSLFDGQFHAVRGLLGAADRSAGERTAMTRRVDRHRGGDRPAFAQRHRRPMWSDGRARDVSDPDIHPRVGERFTKRGVVHHQIAPIEPVLSGPVRERDRR